jgi:uncharacterized protein (TIGR02284 family)
MMFQQLSGSTLDKIRVLIDANFSGRDELYAAAESLDDEARKGVCRRLAEHLADHAAELEQILLASSDRGIDELDADFIDHLSERTFLEMVKDLHGESRVLAENEQCERNLKEKYDRMIRATSESEAEGVLKRHRDDVEFAENVLHAMQAPPDSAPSADRAADP